MQHDNNISGQVINIVLIWVLENVLSITSLKVFEHILDSAPLPHTLLVLPIWSWFTRCWDYIFVNISLETIIQVQNIMYHLYVEIFFSIFNLTWKCPGLQRKDSGEGRIKLSALKLSDGTNFWTLTVACLF